MAKTNEVVNSAEDMMADNEWTVEEYLEYVEEMDAQDFRKYYGKSDIGEARRILMKA